MIPMKTAHLSARALLFVVPVAVFAQAGDNTADHAEMMANSISRRRFVPARPAG